MLYFDFSHNDSISNKAMLLLFATFYKCRLNLDFLYCSVVHDRHSNYPRPEELVWTRIERHKDSHSMPRWLHIRDETVGTSIKAILSRLEVLPKKLSSHHLRRTTASKKSLFIGPTKS